MSFEIEGGVPDGYEAIAFRKVKRNEIYLVLRDQRNYAILWKSKNESLDQRIILKKTKLVDGKC